MHGFPHFPVLAAAAEGSAPDVTRLVTVLILAIVLFTGIVVVVMNLVADILYGALDPRIRLD